jgi:transposase
VASVAVVGRADLADAQWAVLEPLLPKAIKPVRPPKWNKRQLINGIRWRNRWVPQPATADAASAFR